MKKFRLSENGAVSSAVSLAEEKTYAANRELFRAYADEIISRAKAAGLAPMEELETEWEDLHLAEDFRTVIRTDVTKVIRYTEAGSIEILVHRAPKEAEDWLPNTWREFREGNPRDLEELTNLWFNYFMWLVDDSAEAA